VPTLKAAIGHMASSPGSFFGSRGRGEMKVTGIIQRQPRVELADGSQSLFKYINEQESIDCQRTDHLVCWRHCRVGDADALLDRRVLAR